MDVAVIGGGVIGLACARELAEAGAEVVVLEALAATGHGSTARANGGIRAQFATEPNILFSRFSIEAYRSLARTRPEVGYEPAGYLLMTGTPEGEAALVANVEQQHRLGVPTEVLDAAEVAARAPMVRTDGLRIATFHAADGVLDPAGSAAALRADAEAAGARVRTSAAVTAIDLDGAVWRLTHDGGPTRAEVVVNAAGPDARTVAALVGTDLPVQPVPRNLALFLASAAERTPMLVDLDTGVLARREPAGGWVVGYADPVDPPSRDTTFDPAFLEALAGRVPHRFPFLSDLPVDPARCWAGLYPETPDHHAIVGPDPRAHGVLHAVGFGGHGVMHAPAAGRAVAELAATGRCATFDLHPLRPERFAEDDLIVETLVI